MSVKSDARNVRTEAAEDGAAYLKLVGQRVRSARARRGMTRKILSRDSGVSERYLADLEGGRGNISILLMRQVAAAMHIPLEDLVRDREDPPVELSLIIEHLRRRDAAELATLHEQLKHAASNDTVRSQRIALIGLRGAGKSTLGRRLAQRLAVPFMQLNKEIEAETGMSLNEVFDLFGQAAYRRLERKCLERVLEHDRSVIETGGSLVSEPATYDRLLASCFTVWLTATPEEHMTRVAEQGDHRPMAGNREAMSDLRRILDGRDSLYRKADAIVDTSGRAPEDCLDDLETLVKRVAGI